MQNSATRRNFLKHAAGITVGASLGLPTASAVDQRQGPGPYEPSERLQAFRKILADPVLDRSLLSEPVVIDDLQLLQTGKHFFLKVTSKEGAEGYSVLNKKYVINIYPLMINRIFKFWKDQDARDLEQLIEATYLGDLNYKWQGLAFWVGVAYVELAVLDLLGKVAQQPAGELLGGRIRDEVAIYYASGHRGNAAEAEVEYLQSLVEKSGAKAVKYRLGARMHYNDASTQRDKRLVPMVREALGEEVTVYTDANGSYDVKMGIEIGKMLEEHQTSFFEEPCPFDHYEETRAVAAGLKIPIAGGEEEVSTRQFMWLMDKDIYKVVQPDLLFYGGLTRSIKVARMAEHIGIPCTPHISGKALGFLYMMQFASCVPNIGPFQEFKGNSDEVPVASSTSSLQPKNGIITIPKEPGLGVTYDPDFLQKGAKITSI